MRPLMKAGQLISPTYLDWVRGLPCSGCGKEPRNEAHHFPSKGASGGTNDIHVLSVCHSCHRRAEGATVLMNGHRMPPISAEEQTAIVARTFMAFVERGRQHHVDQVMRDIRRWRESVVFTELVPE